MRDPESASSKPAKTFINVDFPHPFRPTRAIRSARFTTKFTFENTEFSPNVREILFNCIKGDEAIKIRYLLTSYPSTNQSIIHQKSVSQIGDETYKHQYNYFCMYFYRKNITCLTILGLITSQSSCNYNFLNKKYKNKAY